MCTVGSQKRASDPQDLELQTELWPSCAFWASTWALCQSSEALSPAVSSWPFLLSAVCFTALLMSGSLCPRKTAILFGAWPTSKHIGRLFSNGFNYLLCSAILFYNLVKKNDNNNSFIDTSAIGHLVLENVYRKWALRVT